MTKDPNKNLNRQSEKMFIRMLCTVVFAILVLVPTKGENLEDVQNVLDSFFAPTKYNKMIRGLRDQKTILEVNISFKILSIVNVNEVEETLEVMGVLYISWFDERLVWNPADFNGTTMVHVFQNEVWKPELVLANPAKSTSLLGNDRVMSTHFWNGTANWNVGDLFKFCCSLDVTSFPWDVQTCTIQFLIWGYHSYEVNLTTPSQIADLTYFSENGAWELLSAETASEATPLPTIFYTFQLRRHSQFAVVNIFIPILTLTFLNILALFIPPESGEKLSYCITVLLALAVFLSLVANHLPKNSNNMASLCYYLLFLLMISTLICASSVLSVGLYHQADKSVPPKWLRGIVSKLLCMDRSQTKSTDGVKTNVAFENLMQEMKGSSSESAEKVYDYITWRDVSRFINRLAGVITITCLIVSTILFVYFVLQ